MAYLQPLRRVLGKSLTWRRILHAADHLHVALRPSRARGPPGLVLVLLKKKKTLYGFPFVFLFFLGDLLDAFLPARPLSLHARADRCFSVLSWAHGEPLLFPAAVAPVRGCPEAPNGAVRVPPPEAPSPSHASAAWWLWSPLLLAQKPSSDSWDSLVGSRGQGPTGLSGLWAACAGACWSPRTGVPLSARHRLLGWALRCMGRSRGALALLLCAAPPSTVPRLLGPQTRGGALPSPVPCSRCRSL